MKVLEFTHTPKGINRVAKITDKIYIVQTSVFEYFPCKKVKNGYKIVGRAMVGGMMMRTDDEFLGCVNGITEDELQTHLAVQTTTNNDQKAKKTKTYEIVWDTDGKYIPDLPKHVTVSSDKDLDELVDELSDEYGFCINAIYESQ